MLFQSACIAPFFIPYKCTSWGTPGDSSSVCVFAILVQDPGLTFLILALAWQSPGYCEHSGSQQPDL